MPPKQRSRPRKSSDQAPPHSSRSALSARSNPPASSSSPAQQSKRSGKRRRTSTGRTEEDDDDDVDELQELPSTVTATAPTSSSKKSAASRRSSGTGAKSSKTSTATNASKPKANKRTASDADLDASTATAAAAAADQPAKKFAHLKPRTRHISQSVITTKWRPAPPPAQHAARALFVAAKRPVVEAAGRGGGGGGKYDRRRAEAEATLASVLRKLDKQVPRIPFPGSLQKRGPGQEVFDLDKVVERNREAEARLTPAVHAVGLLREAVRGEEGVLAAEREALEVLRGRAKEAERAGRERGRRGVHPALKRWRGRGGVAVEDGVDDIRLVRRAEDAGDGEELEADEALAPVLEQLSGHLDSMRANLEQVEGLDEAMVDARVALEGALKGRITEEQYQQLVSSSS